MNCSLMWPPPCVHVFSLKLSCFLFSPPPDCRLGSAAPDPPPPELLLLCLMSPARPNPVCTRYNFILPLRQLNSSRGVKVRGTVDRKQFAITCRFLSGAALPHREARTRLRAWRIFGIDSLFCESILKIDSITRTTRQDEYFSGSQNFFPSAVI